MQKIIKLDNHNTNFTITLFELLKKINIDPKYNFLKYHQNLVREFIMSTELDSRGLLINHEMGLGKSILAISIAIDNMDHYAPIMLLTKSLHENMKDQIRKYVSLRKQYDPTFHLCMMRDSELDEWINKYFDFVSLNAGNMLTQMARTTAVEDLETKLKGVMSLSSLEGKLLIVDEAHNLFRAITNGSINGMGLYNAIMKTRNMKIIFLTGTPIATNPFELVPCFNMLGSKRFRVLPEDYHEFNKLYVDDDGNIKNKKLFQNRILGLVSSVDHLAKPGIAAGITEVISAEFPAELPIIVVGCPMFRNQFTAYQMARDKEMSDKDKVRKVAQTQTLNKPTSRSSSSYKVHTRQLGNYYFDPTKKDSPIAHESPKFKKILENVKGHEGTGIVYSQFTAMGGLGALAAYLIECGWVNVSQSAENMTETFDINDAIENAETADSMHDTPEPENMYVMEDAQDAQNAQNIDNTADVENASDVFDTDSTIDTSDTFDDEMPNKMLDVDETDEIEGGYSARSAMPTAHDYIEMLNNKVGGLDWWEIPPTDIEGGFDISTTTKKFAIYTGKLDFAERSRLVSLFNSDDNMDGGLLDLLLISSVGAEGLDLKNVRSVHVLEPYWNWGRIAQVIARAVRNNSHIKLPVDKRNVQPYIYTAISPDDPTTITTDLELYNESVRNMHSLRTFTEALHEVSIECMINGGSCYVCSPNNQAIMTPDATVDARSLNPCEPVVEKILTTDSVVVDGITYQYIKAANSIYGYDIYVMNDVINTYVPLKESDPLYLSVLEKITASHGNGTL